jgi:hypothetical protein
MAKNSTIYQKRGNLNFKERKMISEINAVLEKSPELEQSIVPASNFDELKELHTKYIAEVVEFEEVAPSSSTETPKSAPIIDPLNRDEPNVREYVMDDKFDPFADFTQSKNSNYQEPTNYGQAFDLPDEEDMSNPRQNRDRNSQKSNSKQNQRPQPIMSGEDTGKDKRRSKRFAKSIINTTCNLIEVGFVWFATKDINESKLVEYELTNEIDVNSLLEMPNGAEITVREFFLSQLGQIESASKITQEEREDLTDGLTEIFIEKNIQPSPAYEFGMTALSVVAKKGIQLYMISTQNNQIINQLREKNALLRGEQPIYREPEAPTPPFQSESVAETVISKRPASNKPSSSPEYLEQLKMARESENNLSTEDDIDMQMENELSLLEQIETKE